ncbi:MAG: FAD-binding oxidoreductase [Steroidobacteraceae bacterium]
MPASPLTPVQSWGRIGAPIHNVVTPSSVEQARAVIAREGAWLAYGMGRSYGDVALNSGGTLLSTRALDRFVVFDRESGVLEAEAGVTLEEVIRIALPHGWFLPTTPGTKYISLGGAVANDVHGKNHHRAGTFGCWVHSLEIARSDGSLRTCGPDANEEIFRATIGGLGMTGLITRVRLQLIKVPGAFLDSEDVAFASLDEFFELTAQSDAEGWEHTVAWMDCVSSRRGRGIFSRANWSPDRRRPLRLGGFKPSVPVDAPSLLLNRFSVSTFNELYFRIKAARAKRSRLHFNACFYPLDGIVDWNRLYGRFGFYQYQCVLPRVAQHEALKRLLHEIAESGQPSFLAVVKAFGERSSPGLLSFPFPGTHIALDFPNRGPNTRALFERLDAIVAVAGGRLYPAKDARMPADLFRSGYPAWTKLDVLKDPHVQSDFWRRVAG